MKLRPALPLLSDAKPGLDEVFDGLLFQRTRLKVNQQLPDWDIPGSRGQNS